MVTRMDEATVGHVSLFISTLILCSLLIRRGGSIYFIITDWRQYSSDFPQGGMEIPCMLRFVGQGKEF